MLQDFSGNINQKNAYCTGDRNVKDSFRTFLKYSYKIYNE